MMDERENEAFDPRAVFEEYERARAFNEAIDLYETVEKNEDFYIGNQWRGVHAPDLDKPVMNVLARVVKFFIASVVSDDIAVGVTDFEEDESRRCITKMLEGKFDEIMEATAFKKKTREVIRNAAVDGDGCLHYFFNTEASGAQPDGGGMIEAEIVENTDIHFGNPQMHELQKQPYLLLNFRRLVGEVRQMAQEREEIYPDEPLHREDAPPEHGKVTVIRKYWKRRGENGRTTVWFCEVTKDAVVTPPTDTGLERYPVAFFAWEKVKRCFHGQAAITGMIPNQIFINKLFAMSMQHIKSMAFPKIVYNRSLLPRGWSNRVGEAIAVNGDPNIAIAANFKAQDMSAQVLQMIEAVITYTRDTMGASDAVLGNIKPENTSAIVATQQATSMPLELQKQDFYSFVEDSVRIWLDMMGVYYGMRPVKLELTRQGPDMQSETVTQTVLFDFTTLRGWNLQLNVEVGAATYWSELMQVQTLDNLFSNGILQDAVAYLENMPRGYIPGKTQLIEAIKRQQAAAAAAGTQEQHTQADGALKSAVASAAQRR